MTGQKTEKEAPGPFTVLMTEPESWKRVLSVSIDSEYFAGEYARNLRDARRKFQRPGFRKGKVPMAMVEQDVGGEVRMHTLDEIVPKAYQAAMTEHELVPVCDPLLENLKMDTGEPISLDLIVEIRPEIEAGDYNDLPLPVLVAELEDGAVDAVLERLQESRATWSVVERAATDQDRVLVDIAPLSDDGQPDLQKNVEDYPFEIGLESNFEEFNTALKGASVGDSRNISVVYPDDYYSEDLRGKAITYRVIVKKVEQKDLPELTDDFAATLVDGQTLLELRAKTRDELLAELENRNRQQTHAKIIDLLIERNPLDLPPSLINQYLDSGVEELKSRSEASGRALTEQDITAYREGGREVAERTLRSMILLESVRKLEDIQVGEEEINAHIDKVAAENNFPADEYRDYMVQNGQIERLKHDLAEEKTLAFLQSRATFPDAAD